MQPNPTYPTITYSNTNAPNFSLKFNFFANNNQTLCDVYKFPNIVDFTMDHPKDLKADRRRRCMIFLVTCSRGFEKGGKS